MFCCDRRVADLKVGTTRRTLGNEIADGTYMKVRIIRQAGGVGVDIAPESLRPGRVYDLPPGVAQYLIAEGFAEVERRQEQPPGGFTGPDRRKFYEVIDEHRTGRKSRS